MHCSLAKENGRQEIEKLWSGSIGSSVIGVMLREYVESGVDFS